MATVWRWARASGMGLMLPALTVGLAWAISTDDSIGGSLMPYGFLITITWWVTVVLGVAAAIPFARHWAAGVVVAVGSIVFLQVSLALVADPMAREQVMSSTASWAGAVVGGIIPWALGTAFGTTVMRNRRERYDGVGSHA